MKKQVSMIHLIYLIIISVIVLSFVSILAFGGSPEAGNQMNVAATAVSIILAVIAILMTLVDVAGQRQSMIDLKETAESLRKSNETAQKMIKESLDTVKKFDALEKTIIESVESFREETIKTLEDIQKKGGNVEEIKTLIQKLQKEDKSFTIGTATKRIQSKSKRDKVSMLEILDWFLDSEFKSGKVYYYEYFLDKISDEFGHENTEAILEVLKASNFIKQVTKDSIKII